MKAKYKAAGAFDAACMKWLGIPATHATRLVMIGLGVGAVMETFMVKVWIGKTNCMRERAARQNLFSDCSLC